MLVRTNFYAVVNAGLEDELSESLKALTSFTVWLFWVLRGFENAEESLNHMVSMSIQTQLFDRWLEGLDDREKNPLGSFCVFAQSINQSLHSSCSMHVHRNVHQTILDALSQKGEIIFCCSLKDLLAEVIAKLIHHQISEIGSNGMDESCSENTLLLLFFKPLLEHPAALLIITVKVNLFKNFLVLFGELFAKDWSARDWHELRDHRRARGNLYRRCNRAHIILRCDSLLAAEGQLILKRWSLR